MAMIEEFSYTLEDEKILEYLRLPTEDKLNWLEEILEFNTLVAGEAFKKSKLTLQDVENAVKLVRRKAYEKKR
jgi:hypothetical protein